MYDFIKSKIEAKIIKELEGPVLWNTILKEFKATLETDKPVILLVNNLPSEFDKEIVHGLTQCMSLAFSKDILWARVNEDFLTLLEDSLNEGKTYVAFCPEDLLREFGKKIYFSELCHVAKIELNQENLEELLKHFGQNGKSLREETYTIGEFFLTFFLLSIVKSEYGLIPRLVKNVQYEFVNNRLLLVPKTEILLQYVIDSKNETIMTILGIDRYSLQYFTFYETIQATYEDRVWPPFSRTTLVNLLVSKIIVDKLGGEASLEKVKDLAKFYDLEYFEGLERIVGSIVHPASGYSYAKDDVAAGLSGLIQEKFKMISYAFHGLEYEFTPKKRIEKDLISEDFYLTQKLALLDPIFVKFSDFKLNDDVLNTVLETQMKQIRDTNLILDEKSFKEENTRKNNDTKLISLIGNLVYFNLLERIHGQAWVSPPTKERFVGFLSKIEAQFFSLGENILGNFEKSMGIADIFDSSQISFLDEFLRNVILNLGQIIEGTTFVNALLDLKKDELFPKFLDLYQENVRELTESTEPMNIRKWAMISFFYDYATEYLIETYSEKHDKHITHIIDEIIDHGQKDDFAHIILLVVDGLSYLHWRLIKSDLLEKVKNFASLRLEDFRLGAIISRTPVGHSALFSGLPPFENGVYSDILKFDDSHVNLMEPRWVHNHEGKLILNSNHLQAIDVVKEKVAQNVFKGRHRGAVKFYFFAVDKDSPMTIIFESLLGTKSITPQAKLTKKVVSEEELKFSEEEIKKIAHFVYQLKDRELKGYVSVVQYPDIDHVMHSSGWNFQYYLDQVRRQIENLIVTIKKELGGRILVAITSDHGSISLPETKILTDSLPFKFGMKEFNDLAKTIPSFRKEINRFSYSYLQLFDESQIVAIKSSIGQDEKALQMLTDERLFDLMGKPTIKELKYPKAFAIPKYIMHFGEYSILRHGGCSLNELLIPFVLIEVKK